MAWLTQAHIEDRVQETVLLALADDNGDHIVDANVIQSVAADAEGVVESHIGGRYVVPLGVAEEALVDIAAAIAIHRLYLRQSEESPDHVKEAHTLAMRRLDRIRRGEILLLEAIHRGRVAHSSLDSEDRVFTRDTLRDL
jgi:phage gp36-like protein